MALSIFRQQILEQIIAETGNVCHYCRKQTRLNFIGPVCDHDHATLDHVVPKSKGGTNERSNLVLACNACNNAKGDRSYEDFLARPYRLKPPSAANTESDGKVISILRGGRVIVPVCKKPRKPVEHPAYKTRKGTLAAAINSGEVTDYGMYQGTPKREQMMEPNNRIDPIPYHETMWILTGRRVPKHSEIFDQK